MRITDEQRRQAEDRIRAAIDRLLRGELPSRGRCDLKTLAAQAGVNRTAFYAKEGRPGPFQHLAEEFTRRRELLQQAGTISDPREAQIAHLKETITDLRRRLADRDAEVEELTDFRQRAISQLAAQHAEITRLRQQPASEPHQRVTALPGPSRTHDHRALLIPE
ncbi:hypothetical protein [Streptomyces spectabilis]|uniref:Chromosome segregation ATPase n=1 Tax=Streptomyces spectabilis TaxID=68270 RepID=A0A7W8B448_STRST|nr:hypothetical protein [Streptomyces spectabilis]MBB5109592.1 chromosome segregation ATPase [Streptomyces spectabilis]GGV54710.1 hypothetical protein GCM10010245_86530 [Streptomyces spectabilis]